MHQNSISRVALLCQAYICIVLAYFIDEGAMTQTSQSACTR